LFWVTDEQGRHVAKSYFLSLRDRERAALDAVINRLANEDVEGVERFGLEDGPLRRIRGVAHCLVCFEHDGSLMIASGYPRGYDAANLRREAVADAMKIFNTYFNNAE
jgi:hypothetical protein